MDDNIGWLLFSFSGRIGRIRYAQLFLIQFMAYFALNMVLIRRYIAPEAAADDFSWLADMPPAVLGLSAIYFALLAWIGVAANVKRLHDFNWTGWTLIAPVGFYLMVLALAALLSAVGHRPAGAGLATVGAIGGGLLAGFVLALMFLRGGVHGAERFEEAWPEPDAADWSQSPWLASEMLAPAGASGFSVRLGAINSARRAATAPPRRDETPPASYRAPQNRAAGFGRRGA